MATLELQDTRVVYLASNADPGTGDPLISASDGLRHHELFRGATEDAGASWTWDADARLDGRQHAAAGAAPGRRADGAGADARDDGVYGMLLDPA